MSERDHEPVEEAPDAMRQRLAAMRSRRVDLSRVEASIESIIPRPDPVVLPHPALLSRQRILSVAAVLVALISVVLVFWLPLAAKPAVAAPQLLATIHEQALAMRHVGVSSFEEAQAILAREWASGPDVPTLEGGVPMECCMHKLGSKVLKCVSLEVGEEKLVMVVGRDRDIEPPAGEVMLVDGQEVVLTSSDGVQMAMTEREGRWICLMGRIDGARLAKLAGSIR